MDGVGESSTQNEVEEKPVIVRVKRKVGQSLLDAFWLEINERPLKRPTLDFSKLSISDSGERGPSVAEDVKPKKVLVRHLETVTDSETTADIIHSFFESDHNEKSCSKGKFEERKIAFKKDNRKEQRLTKSVQKQQIASENARFEQIWRSRKGNKEGIHEKCHFFDVIRVDTEERRDNAQEFTSLEDQKMLASFLPLLRECIPTAAEEIEADIQSSHTEEYVYDYYAVNEEMDISEDSSKNQFPLVIVEDEEEFCDGSDESDYDSEDSNAEDHPKTDYPEEEEEEEEEENGDEAEEEPRLKYQRMGGNVPALLSNDAASCIAVAARMIALGTHDGTVRILDLLGNQVKEFRAHTAPVNDINFDTEGEYIGSCSDDGSVVINSLFTDDEKMKFDYHRPMKAISLDPDYTKKQSKRFVAGGLAGHLYMNSKKWFGNKDQVLHSGEGPIHSVKWRGSLIAWANDVGVKVYDTAKDQRVTFIEKPRGSPRPEALLPHLVWQDDTLLVIGWGTSVKIASIKSDQQQTGTFRQIQMSSLTQVDIVASFQTSYYISGIAPFGDSLVILAYIPIEGDGEKEFSSTTTLSRQGNAQRPEIRIVSWNNDELTMDALPVHGFEHYKAKDYSLAHAPFPGSSYAGGQWAAGDEPLYYIVSPKDVVIAKPRDAEDHINWLLQHGFHEKALAAVEASEGRTELIDKVGAGYLDHLIVERKYAEAASLCPKLLRGSASAWERWVFHFAQLRQLPVLVPYMPTDNPRLKDTVYEVALVALATNPSYHKELLSAVKSWPRSVYSALTVISAIEPQLNTSSMTDALKEALAELYVIDGQYQKAFSLYADLLKPEVFDFIEKYSLHEAIRGKVVQLMLLDCKRATVLFIQNRDLIPPSEVVPQLLKAGKNPQVLKAGKKCDSRYYLYLYLHALFEVSHDTGKDFHDMQVELYAEYDTKMLLPFLRSSQHYKLEKAYELCVKKDFLREQVFVLGRMGNAKQALAVIINKLGDIEEAVEFVSMQHDDDLWEELIKQCLNKPEMVGLLLEHTVGNLDPLYIVNMVPNGLEIPRLRDRLVKIVTDYRTETSLRHGCNDILKTDIVNLLVKCFNEARRGVCLSHEDDDSRAKREDNNRSSFSQRMVVDKSLSIKMTEVKSKTRGDTRCCMCFDPVSIRGDTVVVFFCCHAYHETCLMDAAFSNNNHKTTKGSSGYEYSYDNGVDEEEEDEEEDEDGDGDRPGRSRLRCILCTTAAAASAR